MRAYLPISRAREALQAPEVSDSMRLYVLSVIARNQPYRERAETQRQRRAELLRLIAESAERGKIAVVESGRDCDGVEYGGHVTLIRATARAYDRHIAAVGKWADGPFYLDIMKPSAARQVGRYSRDLALEAFEDGHPHCLISDRV